MYSPWCWRAQWQCNDEGEKVAAKKGLAFKSFPAILTLHLKRFVYDYATMRRREVNDPIRIGFELDLNPFLENATDGGSAEENV